MLQPFLSQLSKHQIILASGSPRRQEILKTIGLTFDVIPSTFEENLDINNFENAIEFVKETARQKALEVAERTKRNKHNPYLIIGADTVVMHENEIFGKPKTKLNAAKMLERLSGKTHQVYTGVALLFPEGNTEGNLVSPHIKLFHEGTDVSMCKLSSDIIKGYVDTDEPLDKAGGYGIQGIGGSLIEAIQGDYYNVMGFPLHHFCREMNAICCTKFAN